MEKELKILKSKKLDNEGEMRNNPSYHDLQPYLARQDTVYHHIDDSYERMTTDNDSQHYYKGINSGGQVNSAYQGLKGQSSNINCNLI